MSEVLYPTNCDDCGCLMAYMTSHPRGYMICPECNDSREEKPASEKERE